MQLLKYFCVALLALFVNLISRHYISFYINFSYSVVIAYILGHFVNFALSAKYIFPRNISLQFAFVRFSIVASFGLVVALFVSVTTLLLLETLTSTFHTYLQASSLFESYTDFLLHQKHLEFVAHVCGVGMSFVCNYLGHKYFSFTKLSHTTIS
ncbi:GtrA domain-containing protein [Helicobacter equorum]|uniref:GtrA family protein n=1 Tax=Helicobacter equorum TaxID=361872 RepID=UPI000CF07B3A|nr:GtrA family protein [Helicobacter equorum]